MSRPIAVAVCLSMFLAAPAALAETAPIGADVAAPGSDPAHQTPLELLASEIASHIAGVGASVRCEDSGTWAAVASSDGVDPNEALGFVSAPSDYYPSTDTWASSSTLIELSPTACTALQQFAQATTKPTECRATTNSYVTTTKDRFVTRWKRTRVKGVLKWVKRRVLLPYKVTTLEHSLAPPAPCFVGAPSLSGGVCAADVVPTACFATVLQDDAYWQTYDDFAQAIMTLAHEPIHVWQDQEGQPVPSDSLVEAQATCSGLQWMPYVAERLGASPDDAQSVADYFWKVAYPGMRNPTDAYSQSHPYWSADCFPGGKLDVRAAGSTVWP